MSFSCYVTPFLSSYENAPNFIKFNYIKCTEVSLLRRAAAGAEGAGREALLRADELAVLELAVAVAAREADFDTHRIRGASPLEDGVVEDDLPVRLADLLVVLLRRADLDASREAAVLEGRLRTGREISAAAMAGGVSVALIVVAVKMALPAIAELTEASLPDDIENHIIGIIESVPGIMNAHDLKTRRTGPDIVIDVHVLVDAMMSVAEAHDITEDVENALRQEYGYSTQVSIHVEPYKS